MASMVERSEVSAGASALVVWRSEGAFCGELPTPTEPVARHVCLSAQGLLVPIVLLQRTSCIMHGSG